MATQVQLRRGTTVQHSTFTGAVGEVTFDTDKNTLIVHDGSTAGGYELAKTGVAGSFTTGAFSSDVTITGNLTVNGTTTTVNSNTLEIGDNQIVLNADETGTPSQNGGIEIERGTSTNVVLRWNETTDTWQATEDGTNYYNILLTDDIGVSVQGYDANNVVSDASSTFSADQNFGDNVKAQFGASNDLQIYHDTTASRIVDVGTGSLKIQAESFAVNNVGDTENMITAVPDGAVQLFYDGGPKLSTTSSGVSVTGNITSSSGLIGFDGGDNITFSNNSFATINVNSVGRATFATNHTTFNDNGDDVDFRIESDTRDHAFFLEGNTGRVGLGTSAPADVLSVYGGSIKVGNTGNVGLSFHTGEPASSNQQWFIANDSNDGNMLKFYGYTNGTYNGEKVVITNSGNVGIGDSDPSEKLNVVGNIMLEGADQYMYLSNVGTGNAGIYVRGISTAGTLRSHATSDFRWELTGSQKMMLDSSGNLLIGTTDDQPPTNSDVSGIALRADGKIAASRDNGIAGDFNNNNAGNIVWFRKNGSVVATVSTRTGGGDAPYFGGYTNADTAIAFSSTRIYPVTSSGAIANGTRDLGNFDAQFKDGYFAGTLRAARGVGATSTATLGGPTVTADLASYTNFVWTLAGNITISNPTTEIVGQSGFFVFKQDSTGGRTVSLSSEFLTAGGAGLTLSTAANAIDMVPYVVIASGQILLGTPQLAFA
jgi:hypothetical protein